MLRTAAFRALVLAGVATVVTALLAGCGSGDEQPQDATAAAPLNGVTLDPTPKIDDLELPDFSEGADGEPRSLTPAEGGLMLVYFGYTSCPDVCPTTLADLRLALADLPAEQREAIEVAMVTVDPERDTPEVLSGYLGNFFEPEESHALRTADADLLARAEDQFGASHRIGKPDKSGAYDVDHTALVYAVNADGEIEVQWPFGTTPDDITADLETLGERLN